MATEQGFIAEYGKFAIETILGIITGTLALLTYKQKNKIKALGDERDYLRKGMHKITSKVEPESDRVLVMEADKSVQMMGINSLGPLHHCHEEIIRFLIDRKQPLLQVLLLDPESEAFEIRAKREKDSSQRLLSEWRASLSILKDIQLRTNAQIELRLRSDRPDRSLFIVDGLPEIGYTTKMLVNYYPEEIGTRGYSGTQYLAEFELERDRDTVFKNIDYYSSSWERARTTSIDAAIELGNQLELKRLSLER